MANGKKVVDGKGRNVPVLRGLRPVQDDPKSPQEALERRSACWPRPRYEEVAIHCPTFVAVASRARLDEGQLLRRTSVARNTVRRCLGLDGRGPVVNIKRDSFDKLVHIISTTLGEKFDATILECELDAHGLELVGWQKSLRRHLLSSDDRLYLDAALSRSAEVLQMINEYDFAQAFYAALCNNLWYRKDPMDAAWCCSWREASALVALLRDSPEPNAFYAGGNEGYVRDDVGQLIYRVTDWTHMNKILLKSRLHTAQGRLAELAALPSTEKSAGEELYWLAIVTLNEKYGPD